MGNSPSSFKTARAGLTAGDASSLSEEVWSDLWGSDGSQPPLGPGRHAQLSHRRDAAKASRRASDEPRRAHRSRRVQARGAHRAGRRQGIVRRGRGPEGRVPPPDPAEGAHARDPVRDRIERLRRRRRRRSGARRPPLGPLLRDLPVPASGSHLARARSPRAAPLAPRRARRTPSPARSHPR